MGSKTHFIKVIKCFVAGASVLQYNTCLVMMMMKKIVLCETAFFFSMWHRFTEANPRA